MKELQKAKLKKALQKYKNASVAKRKANSTKYGFGGEFGKRQSKRDVKAASKEYHNRRSWYGDDFHATKRSKDSLKYEMDRHEYHNPKEAPPKVTSREASKIKDKIKVTEIGKGKTYYVDKLKKVKKSSNYNNKYHPYRRATDKGSYGGARPPRGFLGSTKGPTEGLGGGGGGSRKHRKTEEK